MTQSLNAISSSSELNTLRERILVQIGDLESKHEQYSSEVTQLEAFMASSSSKAAFEAVEKARNAKQNELDQSKEEKERLHALLKQVEQLGAMASKSERSPPRTAHLSGSVRVEHFLRAARGDATLLAASVEKLLDLMDLCLLKEVANVMGIKYENYVTELELKDRIRLTQVIGRPSLDASMSVDDFRRLLFSLNDEMVLNAINRSLEKMQKSTCSVINEAQFLMGDFELEAEYITEKVMSLALQEAMKRKQAEAEEKQQLLNKLEKFQDILEERLRSMS